MVGIGQAFGFNSILTKIYFILRFDRFYWEVSIRKWRKSGRLLMCAWRRNQILKNLYSGAIEQLEAGKTGKPEKLRVYAKWTSNNEEVVGKYDTVLFAIGRYRWSCSTHCLTAEDEGNRNRIRWTTCTSSSELCWGIIKFNSL